MHSRNEYAAVLRERYHNARTKEEKSRILNEYCTNTKQCRKHAIRKLRQSTAGGTGLRRKRKVTYDGRVSDALAGIWEQFDYPCGQRLAPVLKTEIGRLRELGELKVSEEVAGKLAEIAPATIDRKLKHQRETLHLSRSRGGPGPGYLLKKKIPIRLTQWDTSKVGFWEVDTVFHCGSSTLGEHINTVSATEIASGWWDGQPVMGKAPGKVFDALLKIRGRTPFEWKGIDSDNGSEFLGEKLYNYCNGEGHLEFTRSRPNRKNDNAYIEGKNWTHVRKVVGYLRYDTLDELVILDEIYADLRLYKNYFQPQMQLISKERIGGHLKRKYATPKTPYQRLLDSGQLPEEAKDKLRQIHDSLNPIQLKRSIDGKLNQLYQAYEKKQSIQKADPQKKQSARTVTSKMIQQASLR